MNKALFLDRDGVVICQKAYLSSPDEVELEKGVAEGLKKLRAAGILTVVVTNQSGVARGLFTAEAVEAVHRKIDALLAAEGAAVDGYYVCPHHPDFGSGCDCRKPKPGLLLRAARELDISLADSVMCGDKTDDLRAGKNAGCRAEFLVRTGYGREEESKARAAGFTGFCDDFSELTRRVLAALR